MPTLLVLVSLLLPAQASRPVDLKNLPADWPPLPDFKHVDVEADATPRQTEIASFGWRVKPKQRLVDRTGMDVRILSGDIQDVRDR